MAPSLSSKKSAPKRTQLASLFNQRHLLQPHCQLSIGKQLKELNQNSPSSTKENQYSSTSTSTVTAKNQMSTTLSLKMKSSLRSETLERTKFINAPKPFKNQLTVKRAQCNFWSIISFSSCKRKTKRRLGTNQDMIFKNSTSQKTTII